MRSTFVRSRSIVAAVAIGAMTLSGCATNPDGSTPNIIGDIGTAFGSSDANLTPEQQALREREKEYSESRLTAAAVGVVAGAVIGGLLGAAFGGRQGAAIGAGAGALAGGAAGYVGGTYLTREHQDFVATRDTLQQDIDAARQDTERMQRNVQVAESALAAQRTRLNQVNADLRAGRINEQQARAQAETAAGDLNSVRALAEESDRRVANLNQSIASYRQAGLPTGDLTRERERQKAHAASLRRIERSMISSINRTPANIRPAVS